MNPNRMSWALVLILSAVLSGIASADEDAHFTLCNRGVVEVAVATAVLSTTL